jgi:hypothetical protein
MASSTFDSSSLYIVPSGIKAGTIFPIKPLGTANLNFARNSNATRVNSAGLIEKVRTNLILHSQTFSNAAWSKSAGTTLTHSQTDPNGGTTATRVVMTSGTNNFFTQGITGSGVRFNTLSIFVKGVTTGGTFSLNTGTAASRVGTAITYTTDWVRYEIIQNETTSNTGLQIDNFSDSVGQVAGDFLIAFAQLETSDFGATPYIPTTTAAVSVGITADIPRLDYTGGGCPSLLLEPQRANTLTFSEQLNNAAWGTTNATITANQSVSPDGFINADKLIDNSTSGLHRTLPTVGSVAANTTYVLSCFAKKAELDYVVLSAGGSSLTGSGGSGADRIASVNLNNGAIVTNNYNVSSVDYGNGWYRISIRLTTDVDGGSFFPYIATSQNGTTVSYVGSGQGVFLWGGQFEVGSYPTSYIPTLGASVTRLAETALKTGISSLIGQTAGTIFFEGTVDGLNSSVNRRIFSISDGTTSNAINIQTPAANARIEFEVTTGGATQALISAANNSLVYGQKFKAAFAYNANDFVAYINGVQIGTDTSGTVPACSKVSFDRGNATSAFEGTTSQAALFTTRLTNAELASITSL